VNPYLSRAIRDKGGLGDGATVAHIAECSCGASLPAPSRAAAEDLATMHRLLHRYRDRAAGKAQ
jgi:hypothetical protein